RAIFSDARHRGGERRLQIRPTQSSWRRLGSAFASGRSRSREDALDPGCSKPSLRMVPSFPKRTTETQKHGVIQPLKTRSTRKGKRHVKPRKIGKGKGILKRTERS